MKPIEQTKPIELFKHIAKNLNTTLITRVITLTYRSARELAKLPQHKQARNYRSVLRLPAFIR